MFSSNAHHIAFLWRSKDLFVLFPLDFFGATLFSFDMFASRLQCISLNLHLGKRRPDPAQTNSAVTAHWADSEPARTSRTDGGAHQVNGGLNMAMHPMALRQTRSIKSIGWSDDRASDPLLVTLTLGLRGTLQKPNQTWGPVDCWHGGPGGA